MLDRDTAATLRAITWEYKGDEWLGALKDRVGNWATIANIMACIRCPWRQQRKRFVASPGLDPKALIEIVIATGLYPSQNAHDYFATPATGATELVNAIPNLYSIRSLLEPSAGTGAIVQAAKERWPGIAITAIEYDELNATILRHLHPDIEVIHGDFLTWTDNRKFDACVMNPPFSANGGYLAHSQKALTHLVPDNPLVTLAPAGAIFNSKQCQPWRVWVGSHEGEIWPFTHEFEDTQAKIDAYIVFNKDPAWRQQPYHGRRVNYVEWLLGLYMDNNSADVNRQINEWCAERHQTRTYPQNHLSDIRQAIMRTQDWKTDAYEYDENGRAKLDAYGQRIKTTTEHHQVDIWEINPFDDAVVTAIANRIYDNYLDDILHADEDHAPYFPPVHTLLDVKRTKPARKPAATTPNPAPTPEPAVQAAFF